MNIVAIRPDALGDSLVTFPILVALRAKYTNPHIIFVGNAGAMPLAKNWGIADEVYNYDAQWDEIYASEGIHQSSLCDLFQQTDLAICWANDTDQARTNLLKAGAREVIMVPIFYREVIQISKDPLHMVEYFAKWVGVPALKPELYLLPDIGNEEFCPYIPPIAIHPGSGSAYIRWPVTSFADIIVSLVRQQYPVLLLAGPKEGKLLTELLVEVRQQMPQISRTGMLTILKNMPVVEVTRHLKQCGCFVGHDTGTSHLAALLRIPTLALFGETYPDRLASFGPTVEVIQEQQLEQLSVERVLNSILRIYRMYGKCDAHH